MKIGRLPFRAGLEVLEIVENEWVATEITCK
jgi:hypothetical protein